MKNIYKIITLALIALVPAVAFAIPATTDQSSGFISPRINTDYMKAAYFVASSTATKSTFPYASTTVISATGICISTDCRTAWPTGGGSGGGTWSTTTSTVSGRLINYTNNTTDIMTVGSNATTTAEFYYDPNTTKGFMQGSFVVGTAQPTYADDNLSTLDIVSDVNGYSFVGIQNKNAGSVASSDLVFANNKTTITDYYADCGISGGNNTDPLFTGIGGSNAFYCFNTDGPVSLGIGTTTSGADFNWTVSSNGGNSYLTSDIKMKLTNGGNLGIGTTSPYAKLSVVGNGGVVAERYVATSTTAFSTFGGRVSVGSTSPNQKLEVSDGNILISSASGQGRGLILSTDVMDDGSRASIKFLRNNFAAFLGDDHSAQSFNFMPALASTRVFSATVRAYGTETGGFANYVGMTHDGTDGYILTGFGDLVLSPATTRVGIGTSSPATELNVSATLPEITWTDSDASTNQKHWFAEADSGVFSIGTTSDQLVKTATRAFSIGATGNVGIGTTSPSARLDIYNGANVNTGLFVEAGATGAVIAQFARRSGAVADIKVMAGSGDPQFVFSSNNTDGYSMGYDISNSSFNIAQSSAIGSSDALVIKGTNVGIGTTSPYAKLSVVGEVVGSYFTATSSTQKSTFINASTTQLTVSDKLFATFSSNILMATSSMGLGTTSRKLSFTQDTQFTEVGCTNNGSGTFQFIIGDGTASTTLITSSVTNPVTYTTLSANNTFVRGEVIFVDFGGVSGTVVNPSCSYTRKTI